MDETNQQEQPIQNIEGNHSKFIPFRIHKKLAILIFAGLFFLAFGVGAYYVGRQSVTTIQIPSLSIVPTTSQISPFLTSNPQVTESLSCPRIISNPCSFDKLSAGCGFSEMAIPLGCPDGCPIVCSNQSNSTLTPTPTNLLPTNINKRDCFPQGECSSNQDCPANMICNQVPGGRGCTYSECPPLR